MLLDFFHEDKGPFQVAPLGHRDLSWRQRDCYKGSSTDHSSRETWAVSWAVMTKERNLCFHSSHQFFAFNPHELLSSCCLWTTTVFLTTKRTLQAIYKHIDTRSLYHLCMSQGRAQQLVRTAHKDKAKGVRPGSKGEHNIYTKAQTF